MRDRGCEAAGRGDLGGGGHQHLIVMMSERAELEEGAGDCWQGGGRRGDELGLDDGGSAGAEGADTPGRAAPGGGDARATTGWQPCGADATRGECGDAGRAWSRRPRRARGGLLGLA